MSNILSATGYLLALFAIGAVHYDRLDISLVCAMLALGAFLAAGDKA